MRNEKISIKKQPNKQTIEISQRLPRKSKRFLENKNGTGALKIGTNECV